MHASHASPTRFPHLAVSTSLTGIACKDGIASLMDKNLLRQIDGSSEAPRFVMLETIREFALERLTVGGQETKCRERHAAWSLALVDEADRVLFRFSDEGR